MLFTRCPNCETTFRITADTLRVASGAVRCGNCATVYSAFSGLRQDALDPGMQPEEDFLSPTLQTRELAAIAEIASPDIADAPTVSDENPEPDAASGTPLTSEWTSAGTTDGDVPLEASPPVEIAVDTQITDQATLPATDSPVEPALDESAAEAVGEHSDTDEPIAQSETTDEEPAAGSGAMSESLRFEALADDEWSMVLREIEETTDDDAGADASTDGRESDWDDPNAEVAELESYGTPAEFFDIGEPNSLEGSRHLASPQIASAPQLETAESGEAGGASAAAVRIDAALDLEQADEVPISAEEVDATLSDDLDTDLFAALRGPIAASPQPGNRRLMWRVGAAAMATLLVIQLVHHNRTLLATQSGIGSLLQTAYAAFGVTLAPDWNLDQYEISNWAAAAGETESGIGSLRITAQIRNGGPAPQPYPSIQLELKDRWESVIGRRIFAPREYLGAGFVASALMAAGETVPAELAVVDPGLDASGFELDVCVENNDASYRCAADRVFD